MFWFLCCLCNRPPEGRDSILNRRLECPHSVGCKYACDGFERAFHVLSTSPRIDNANAHRAVPVPGRSAKKRGAFTIDCLDGPIRLRVVICRSRVGTAVEKSH